MVVMALVVAEVLVRLASGCGACVWDIERWLCIFISKKKREKKTRTEGSYL